MLCAGIKILMGIIEFYNLMSKIFELASLIRTKNLIISNLSIIVTFYLFNQELNVLYIICSLIVMSCMASGYIINDILDTKTDIINKKNNYIATGAISKQHGSRLSKRS